MGMSAEDEFDNADENIRLNHLWDAVRNCFNDMDEGGVVTNVKN